MQEPKIRLHGIYAENLGPVKLADIKLRDVTVLMGPNNTGKTYTAMLILLAEMISRHLYITFSMKEPLSEVMKGPIFLQTIHDHILDVYSVPDISKIIKQGEEKAIVKFTFEIDTSPLTNLLLTVSKTGELSISWEPLVPRSFGWFNAVYLTAERAGVMRAYRQLLRLYVQTVTPYFSRRIETLRKILGEEAIFHSTVRKFLDQLLKVAEYKKEKGADDIVEFLEREVLQGRVELKEDLSAKYYPKDTNQAIDMLHASSMVTELSGIYLMFTLAKEGDFFVVEEPESHIHPRGQLALARFFARLANKGVRVFITTHSDLIALKLAQLVGLNGLSTEQLKKLGYDESDRLSKERLSIYFMKPTPEGSVSEEIQVSETGEVEELPTYSHVIEEMYGEAVKLLDLHRKIPEPPQI